MINLKFGVFESVKQHIHTRKIVSRNVFFLPVDLPDTVRTELFSDINQQGTGTAGKV